MPRQQQQEQEKRTDKQDHFWTIPPIGFSGITGVSGSLLWGGINKPLASSGRYAISDIESDDDVNWFPMGGFKLQTPGNGATIATLVSPIIWQTSIFFNGNVFLFSLCQNGHVYQVSTGGVITDIGPGFTTSGTVDIAAWQGTQIILSDSAAQKIYNWNGTTLTTAISSQPVTYIGVSNGRLWMSFGSTIQWTASGTFNSLGGDAGSFIVSNSLLTNPILGFLDCPAGLYVFGSNWCATISGLQDIGNPAVLIFQFNSLEGNIGPISKWTLLLVGSTIFMANNQGIWALSGANPSQISVPYLNGFFQNLDFTKTHLASAFGFINAVPCIFFQAYYKGDSQMPAGYTVFGYTIQNAQWFRFQQGNIVWITGIVSSAITNNNPTVWGCDGTNIFQMFVNTSTAINSQYNSKLWCFPPDNQLQEDHVLNIALEIIITGITTITLSQVDETNVIKLTKQASTFTPSVIQFVNNTGQNINFINNTSGVLVWSGSVVSQLALPQFDGIGRVRRLGLNVVVNGAGSSLIGIIVTYHRTPTERGS